jgi:hypothetical protein
LKESAPLARPVPFPLRHKLGLFALGALLTLAAVGGVGVQQFVLLRTDGNRLLEESRELALANDLDAHFESIGLMLEVFDRNADAPKPRSFLRTQIADVRTILQEMNVAPGEDPSRHQHQAEELAMTRTLDERLQRLDERVEQRDARSATLDLAEIEEMRVLGARLEEEAREEAEHADHDLDDRSRNAVRAMVITVGLAMLGLGAMLVMVLRTVVRPLRALERRAMALGRWPARGTPSRTAWPPRRASSCARRATPTSACWQPAWRTRSTTRSRPSPPAPRECSAASSAALWSGRRRWSTSARSRPRPTGRATSRSACWRSPARRPRRPRASSCWRCSRS